MTLAKKKPASNPAMEAAKEAATIKIDGFEQGVDTYNAIGARLLREKRDPSVINQTRQNRRNIREARKAIDNL